MHIFIDESGNFSGTGGEDSAVSVIGALTFETARLPRIFQKYERLRAKLPKNTSGEVKGSGLSEAQVASVVELLRRNGAIFHAAMIDMADHEAADIAAHRAKRIESLGANLTEEHKPELHAAIADLQGRMAQFSDPLYAQMVLTIDLLRDVMEEIVNYHAQRNPKELAEFHWVVDAKQPKGITDWEDWWHKTIVIWLQALALERPGAFLAEADFTHFQRFRMDVLPAYLAEEVRKRGLRSTSGIDLHRLFTESFRFSSGIEPGLELVDIVTNAQRRALVGNLGEEGWLPLRALMIHRRGLYVEPRGLLAADRTVTRAYKRVLNHFREGGRDMMAPRFRKD